MLMLKPPTRCLISSCVLGNSSIFVGKRTIWLYNIFVHSLGWFHPHACWSKHNPLLRKFHMFDHLLPVKSPNVSKLIAWFPVSILRVKAPFSAGSNPLFVSSLSIFPWLSHGFPPSPNPAATCESFPGSHLASRAPSSKNRWIVPAGYTMDTNNVGHPSYKLVYKPH